MELADLSHTNASCCCVLDAPSMDWRELLETSESNADSIVQQVAPLLDVMQEISGKRGKTLAQIAINWTLCKGALPIPGAKNAKQVKESAGAFGWRLSADEVAALDTESGKLKPSLANPVENF